MPWPIHRATCSRRDWLRAVSAAAVAGAVGGRKDQAVVKWSAGTEPPALKAPANATDCHHHIYDAKYPVDPAATLRPDDALVDDYRALQKRLGTARGVIVQPSMYGIDNRCTLDALAALGRSARAVAVVNDEVSDSELRRLDSLGVRGIRFNLAQAGATTAGMIEPLARRIAPLGWHIQINAPAPRLLELLPILARVPAQVVFDHLAHIPQPDGVGHPLFSQVCALLDRGRTWVKLSAAYADTRVGPPTYADVGGVARAYVARAPERLVWGSDWPHPTERQKPDDAVLFDLSADWAPDEDVRRRILVDNPAVCTASERGGRWVSVSAGNLPTAGDDRVRRERQVAAVYPPAMLWANLKPGILSAGLASGLLVSACGRSSPAPAAVTFNKDIAPIVFANCAPCHRPGGVAPFSLLTLRRGRQARRRNGATRRSSATCRRGCRSEATSRSSASGGCATIRSTPFSAG